MKMRSLVAVVLLMQSGVAFAQSQAPAPSGHSANTGFQSMDKDRDGKISMTEWKAAGRQERGFQAMDADKDGALTQSEFAAGLERVRQQRASGTAKSS